MWHTKAYPNNPMPGQILWYNRRNKYPQLWWHRWDRVGYSLFRGRFPVFHRIWIEFVGSEFKKLLKNGLSDGAKKDEGKTSGFSFAPDKYYLGRLYTEIDGEADQVVNNLQSFFNEEGELLYTRTDDGKLVGIVTTTDLMNFLIPYAHILF